jgi:hypothetical protein
MYRLFSSPVSFLYTLSSRQSLLYYNLYLYSPSPAPFANIGIVRAGGGRTPKAISARPGDDMDGVDNIASTMTPQRRDQTKLKSDCLARDGNRCLLTRAYDVNKADEILSDEERRNTTTLVTEAAHIIPFSLAAFDELDVLSFSSFK